MCDNLSISSLILENDNVRYTGDKPKNAADIHAARYRYIEKYDQQSIEAINEIYEKDFQYLGYRMLNPKDFAAGNDKISRNVSPFSEQIIAERDRNLLAFRKTIG
jgi:hypothetical protein